MNKKRLIITSVISIVLVAVLMVGSTYSIFTTTEVDDIFNDSPTNAYGLRPVISLSSTVYVTGGSGTMDDPYTIANS